MRGPFATALVPRHRERHAEPLRNGLKSHAFRTQPVSELVEVGALAGHVCGIDAGSRLKR
jgi:hypothetical protein